MKCLLTLEVFSVKCVDISLLIVCTFVTTCRHWGPLEVDCKQMLTEDQKHEDVIDRYM